MALTRPKIRDIDTTITAFNDPITLLHQGATNANVDVGFLFNRANGLVSNVAIYWSETAQSFVTAFTDNNGATNGNITPTSYANLTISSILLVNGTIYANGVPGQLGQFIQSTGSGMQWADGTFSGGPIANVTIFNSNAIANSGVSSTNTTTGAFTVKGGVGITGDVNIGANVVIGDALATTNSATVTSVGTDATQIDAFSAAVYRSAKYVISITDVTNSKYQTSEIVLMQDGTYANIGSYGLVYSGGTPIMSFSANIVSGSVRVYGTGNSASNTVKLIRTLIPV